MPNPPPSDPSLARPVLALLWLAWCTLTIPVRADIITFTSGRQIEGKITAEDEEWIEVALRYGSARFPRDQIQSIQRAPFEVPELPSRETTLRNLYHERLARLEPSDAAGLARLASWCQEQGLIEEARTTAELAVAVDGACAEAHRILGNVQDDEGRWIPAAEYWIPRGYVEYEGEWMLPEEKARRAARDHSRRAHRERRALNVQARHELEPPARELAAAAASAREGLAQDLRGRLTRLEERGRPSLQGLRSQVEPLLQVVAHLTAGEWNQARGVCEQVQLDCDRILRWEDGAAQALEVGAVHASLRAPDPQPTAREWAAFRRINQQRQRMGLAPLRFDGALYRAATSHNLDMIDRGYVDHVSPTPGRETADQRGHAVGVGGQIGENIYYGGLTDETAVSAWGNSLNHARNLFDPGWRRAGLSAVGRYWTMNFAQ